MSNTKNPAALTAQALAVAAAAALYTAAERLTEQARTARPGDVAALSLAAEMATDAAAYAEQHGTDPEGAAELQRYQRAEEAREALTAAARTAARGTAMPDAADAADFVARLARENADDLRGVHYHDAAQAEADSLTPIYNRDALEAWDGSDPDELSDLGDLGGIWGAIRYRVYEQNREGLDAAADAWDEYVDTMSELQEAAEALAEALAADAE